MLSKLTVAFAAFAVAVSVTSAAPRATQSTQSLIAHMERAQNDVDVPSKTRWGLDAQGRLVQLSVPGMRTMFFRYNDDAASWPSAYNVDGSWTSVVLTEQPKDFGELVHFTSRSLWGEQRPDMKCTITTMTNNKALQYGDKPADKADCVISVEGFADFTSSINALFAAVNSGVASGGGGTYTQKTPEEIEVCRHKCDVTLNVAMAACPVWGRVQPPTVGAALVAACYSVALFGHNYCWNSCAH